jgi:hypothetical protein
MEASGMDGVVAAKLAETLGENNAPQVEHPVEPNLRSD